MNYTFSDKTKKICYGLMGVGILSVIYGLISGAEGQRIWANVLVNSFFFMAIAVGATFFMALQYVTEAAYAVVVKRVYEAISTYLPIGGAILFSVLLVGGFGGHHLYHWMDPEVAKHDEVIAGKAGYLNVPFFLFRAAAYILVWWLFQRSFRKRSLEEDMTGGVSIHKKNVKMAAVFIIFFGVTSSSSAWDWIMSIDAHWFSTMFGWYVFSGTWLSAIIMLILFTIYLKRKGHLQEVNENHLHDLGKWMFAISFLWTYLWFCQFMLIWYANIPEEVTYFSQRFNDYKWVMWTMFFINFTLPMLLLMARDSKRNMDYLLWVGCIIFFTHWVDVYQMVMPGTVGDGWHFWSFLELGMFCGYLGLFLFVVHTSLAKAPLMVRQHPFLEECKHLHV